MEGAGAELVGLVRREEYTVCFSKLFSRTGKIFLKPRFYLSPGGEPSGGRRCEMRKEERRAMHSRMPVGHADAERQSGRAGMWRKG